MFQNKLREERVVRRIRQIDLVVKTGINPAKISLVENGLVQAKPEEKEKLAMALGVKVEALFPPPVRGKSKKKAPAESAEQAG